LDAAGTYAGGRLTDRYGVKSILIATTVIRGLAMAAVPLIVLPVALSAEVNHSTIWTTAILAAAYGPESFARGIADTARSVVASKLAGDNIVLMKKNHGHKSIVF
jgi:MFS family permease